MLNHLIVPLDGSRLAEAALPLARQLAEKLRVPVMLVHLIERRAPRHIHGEPHLSDAGEAERYLSGLRRRFFPLDARIEHHVHASGVPDVPRAIVEHAAEWSSDLVVLCTHGQSDLRALLLGSIAQQVAAAGATPVLLIHPGQEGAPPAFRGRPLVVLLGGDAADEQGLALAVELAQVCHSALHLVRVVPTLRTLSKVEAASGWMLPGMTTNLLQLAHEDASHYLSLQIARLKAEGLEISGEVLRGDPSEMIVKTARRLEPDLIVLSSPDRVGLAAWGADYVASKVFRSTHLPLLLVPKPAGSPERP